MDSRLEIKFKENEDKKIEDVGTAKRYIEGNYGRALSPPGAVESQERRKALMIEIIIRMEM